MEKNNHKNIFNPNQLEKLDKFAELIYFENKKLRFEIHQQRAVEAKLKISSKLLRLAKIFEE